MKTLCTLVATVLLVSMLHKVHLSNPNSETVQGSSSSDDSNDQNKSAAFRMEDDIQERFGDSQRSPVLTSGTVVRPNRMGLRYIPLSRFSVLSAVANRRSYFLDHRVSNRRPDMVVPTDDKTSNVKTDARGTSLTALDSNPGNNINSVGVGYSSKFQPPNSSNDPRPFNNEEGNRRDQNVRPAFPNGQITRDTAFPNPSNPVFGRNESFSNFGLNRGSPLLPKTPPNTPESSSNRGVFNRDMNPPPKRPALVAGITPNPIRRISPDSNLFASMINEFGFKLVEIMNMDTNFVLSPLSIFLALSMCYMGSDGSTKEQLQAVLGLNSNVVHGQRFHQGVRGLLSSILTQSSNYELYLANGMFLGKNITFNKEFEEYILRFYDAELKNVDFQDPQSSVPIINEWVSRNTRSMIPSISDTLPSPLTRLLVLNAIFFKGIWKKQFPLNMTYEGRFYSLDGSDKIIPTMLLYRETFPFYRSEEHRTSFIKLPYEGDEVSMIIALPFARGEKPMTGMKDQILCYVRDALTDTKMGTVAIPRFRFEYIRSLKGSLTKLGITHLFNPYTADLSKMTSEKDISVSNIVQKAVIDVNERGTSASASTAIKFVPLSYKNKTDFIVNHPFAFYIVHEPTGLLLFYGKIFDIGDRRGVAPNNHRDSNPRGVPNNVR